MTEWDKLYRPLLEKQKVEGYLKEEVRKMSEEELCQLVLKAAEEAARLEEESPERDENQSNGSRTFTGFYGRISARTSLMSL